MHMIMSTHLYLHSHLHRYMYTISCKHTVLTQLLRWMLVIVFTHATNPNWHTRILKHMHMNIIAPFMNLYAYLHMYSWECASGGGWGRTSWECVCVCVCTYRHEYIHMYVCMCVCTCVFVYMYAYIWIRGLVEGHSLNNSKNRRVRQAFACRERCGASCQHMERIMTTSLSKPLPKVNLLHICIHAHTYARTATRGRIYVHLPVRICPHQLLGKSFFERSLHFKKALDTDWIWIKRGVRYLIEQTVQKQISIQRSIMLAFADANVMCAYICTGQAADRSCIANLPQGPLLRVSV